MKNKLSSIIGTRLPEYIKYGDFSDNFELFLKSYYEFLENRKGAHGLVNFHKENIDVDSTLDEFVDNFFREYGEYFPKNPAHDKRDTLKKLFTLYKTKGTESSVKLFFKLIYGVNTTVSYPGHSVLKASDGQWEQRLSIRVSTNATSEKILNIFQKEIQWDNRAGLQSAIIQEIRRVTDTVYDIFFLKKAMYVADAGDTFRILESDGSTIVSGTIGLTPIKVNILTGGSKFKEGQILRLSGDNRDTIVRVKSIDPADGSLQRLIILEAGGNYTSDRSYTVSSFPFPADIPFRLTVGPDGNPLAEISDRTSGFMESITISKDISTFDPEGYFAQEYISENENPFNTAIIRQISIDSTIKQKPTDVNSAITIEEYQKSIALLTLELGTITTYVGRFVTENGQVSNSNIKVQDSLLYQNFSYIVNSQILLNKYKETFLKLIHPAGYKLFSNLNLDIEIQNTVGVDIARDLTLFLESVTFISDSNTKSIDSLKSDSTSLSEFIAKAVTAPKTESVSLSEIVSKSITAPKTESVSLSEFIAKDIISDIFNDTNISDLLSNTFISNVFDNVSLSEIVSKDVYKNEFADRINTSDVLSYNYTTSISDSIASSDVDTLNNINYSSENYFSEIYTSERDTSIIIT